jgi:hypothetical protein
MRPVEPLGVDLTLLEYKRKKVLRLRDSVLAGSLPSRPWRPALPSPKPEAHLRSEAKSTLFSAIGLLSRPLGGTGWLLHYSRTSSLT